MRVSLLVLTQRTDAWYNNPMEKNDAQELLGKLIEDFDVEERQKLMKTTHKPLKDMTDEELRAWVLEMLRSDHKSLDSVLDQLEIKCKENGIDEGIGYIEWVIREFEELLGKMNGVSAEWKKQKEKDKSNDSVQSTNPI
jgi:hypothetical protein